MNALSSEAMKRYREVGGVGEPTRVKSSFVEGCVRGFVKDFVKGSAEFPVCFHPAKKLAGVEPGRASTGFTGLIRPTQKES